MGLKEPTPAQMELFDLCKRGDTERVFAWLASKRNRRPRTPLNFLRPSSSNNGWISSMREPSSSYTPLHVAAFHGHVEICRALLDSDPHVTTTRDKRGCIPLHLAAWNGFAAISQMLSDFEPESVDVVNSAGESSLHLAAQHGHLKVVGILLDKHSDARLRNLRFETPLDIAARFGHANVCKILLSYCPELALASASECTSPVKGPPGGAVGYMDRSACRVVYPLHVAAKGSHIVCMQILRLAGFDVDFVTEEGSALHVAALHGQIDAVRFLLSEGVNPHIRDAYGRTVINALEEHESERSKDLTQVMGAKEAWRECREMIQDYIANGASGTETLNSSSDSGIDRRDYSRHHRRYEDGDQIWRPLPSTASGFTSPRPSLPEQRRARMEQEERDSLVSSMSLSTNAECGGSLRLPHKMSLPATPSNAGGTNVNRTWNSRLLSDTITVNGKNFPRFPVTSPNTKSRHHSSKRVSDTLPSKMAIQRTTTAPIRGSILPGDGCVYRPPPSYDNWHASQSSHATSASHSVASTPRTPTGYDNAPISSAAARCWEHPCTPPPSATPPRGFGTMIRTGSTASPVMTLSTAARNGTRTLPMNGSRVRPSILNTFRDIDDEGTPLRGIRKSVDTREDSLGITNSPLFARASSRGSNGTFGWSSLERSRSPAALTPRGDGPAPLAVPEELTASTTNSILSTANMSPERTISGESGTRSLTLRKTRSPDEQRIESPAATECSESATSSCSIPMTSHASFTPPSIASPQKTEHNGFGHSDAGHRKSFSNKSKRTTIDSTDNEPLNESEEWKKIDSMLHSFGAMLDTPQVSCFTRDRTSQALTLQLSGKQNATPPVKPTSPDLKRQQTAVLEEWLLHTVHLDAVDAATMALLLQINGFDRVEFMNALDRLALLEMGVGDSIQLAILSTINASPSASKASTANDFNYVSDWLSSLGLKDYLGNFVMSGIKSMLLVRASDLDQNKLNEIGIHKLGHVLRILMSLRQAKKKEQATNKRAKESEKPNRLSIMEQLLVGWVPFSAHYLGSSEISNVNSADEARAVMTRLKKTVREIAKVPQVRLEVSVSGVRISDGLTGRQNTFHDIHHIQIVCQDDRDLNCFTYITRDCDRYLCHVFCVLTADVATEIVITLGQAFDCVFNMQQEEQHEKEERREEISIDC